MKKLIFILFLFAILSCDYGRVVNHYGELDPDILQDAQKIAVFYSEELYPPEDLTREIYDELYEIRTEYGDSNRGISARFIGSWDFSSITIEVEDTVYDQLLEGKITWANELKDSLGLFYSPLFKPYIIVGANQILNSARLAEFFIGLPGVISLGTNPTGWPCPTIYTRVNDGNIVDYNFQITCAPDVYFEWYRFRFIRHGIVDMRHYSTCLGPDFNWSDYDWFQIDSIMEFQYENRPDWVREASESYWLIHQGFHFGWSRDTL